MANALISILINTYTKPEVQTELKNALASIRLRKKRNAERATITVYGKTIPIDDYSYGISDINGSSGTELYRSNVASNKLFKTFLNEP